MKPGRKNVKLTSSQVHIAQKLGVPLEEYAKQLLNTEGSIAYGNTIKINLLVRVKLGLKLKDQKFGLPHHL